MKIKIGKFYKTQSGKKVRIYALDGYMESGIHGAIYENEDPDILSLQGWDCHGRVVSQEINELDIVAEWGHL